MAQLNLQPLIDAVAASKGVKASAKVYIEGVVQRIKDEVAAALAADDAADQGSIDAANAAIAGVVSDIEASDADLAAALVANPGPGPTPVP